MPFYQTCQNGSTLLNKMATRAPDNRFLSLLVVQSVFFPCLCFTRSSCSDGALHDLLSLLVLHKFPTLKFYHGNQTKWPTHINISHFCQLSLAQVSDLGPYVFVFSVSLLSFLFLFLPCSSLSSPLLSLYSLSLGDDTECPARVDVSLNPDTINHDVIILQHVLTLKAPITTIVVCFVFCQLL